MESLRPYSDLPTRIEPATTYSGVSTEEAYSLGSHPKCSTRVSMTKRKRGQKMSLLRRVMLFLATTVCVLQAVKLVDRRFFMTGAFGAASPASAALLPNALPEAQLYVDTPKRRGPTPTDLGLKERDDGLDLKVCGPAPNCFSTTPDDVAPEHFIEAWNPPSSKSAEEAWAEARSAVVEYKPGQQGIDGGGFKIVADDSRYLYAQFESLKKGYVDDLEIALGDRGLLVRSSSRVGYSDRGVNAKRLNALASCLREKGWNAPEITASTHPDYFALNAPSEQVPPSTAFRR